VSPDSTLSPGFAFNCHTVPVISDLTSILAICSSSDKCSGNIPRPSRAARQSAGETQVTWICAGFSCPHTRDTKALLLATGAVSRGFGLMPK
jgi:hypothetical protein